VKPIEVKKDIKNHLKNIIEKKERTQSLEGQSPANKALSREVLSELPNDTIEIPKEVEKSIEKSIEMIKISEVDEIETTNVEPPIIDPPKEDITIDENATNNIFAIGKNNKESNIKEFTNLTRARRKKNVKGVIKADVSTLE